MPETAPKAPSGELNLNIEQEYRVLRTIFNTTILHPLPHQPEVLPYWRDMGNLHLEEGDKVTYKGTAGENEMYGDVISETPIFKPGQSIRQRRPGIVESDVLAMNPLAISNLTADQE